MKVLPDFDIIENPSENSHLWKQWEHLVNSEQWLSDDKSVTTLTPYLKTTRSVFAVSKTPEQNYLGSVVWNEYDDICWLGFFLMHPEHRGKGIGSVIWQIAMERYPKSLTFGLRGVLKMAPKYKAKDTPVDGSLLENFKVKAPEFHKIFEGFNDLKLNQKLIRDLNGDEWVQFQKYDKEVTGRDRHEFLHLYHKKLDFTTGFAFYDQGRIVGAISLVQSGHSSENLFKIAPVFADSDEIAFHAMKMMSEYVLETHPNCTVVVLTLDTPSGSFNVFRKLLKGVGLKAGSSGITLYSREYPAKGCLEKVYIPHNNGSHFDY